MSTNAPLAARQLELPGMSIGVILLVGLSGSGKTNFLEELEAQMDFQHLSAGSLISRGRDLAELDRDSLRKHDIDDNQSLLLRGFQSARDHSVPICILDGHVLIETETGSKLIEAAVFQALGVQLLFHLTVDPLIIVERRRLDHLRSRPHAEAPELRDLQLESIRVAQDIANKLGIEMVEISDTDQERVAELINALH